LSQREALAMARTQVESRPTDFHAEFAGRRTGSILEIDAWMPSEISAISPLVERLMRLIEGSHCITGEELAVELALQEALSNAVIHGNRLDAHKLVHVRCRCMVGKGVSLMVSDQGEGFDARAIPNPLAVENLKTEHGRGIHLMKLAMDQVSFEQRGTEVRMCKRAVRNTRADMRSDPRGS
jgi:serine/threonine-protein kinase RsbW